MPVAAGSPWLLPFFSYDPWSLWPFLGLVLGPFYCLSPGVAHVELIISLLTWPFWCHNSHVISIFFLHSCWSSVKGNTFAGSRVVCMFGWFYGNMGRWGKGWNICGRQPFGRRLTWMMARLLISVHKWHCLYFTPGGLPLVWGAGLGVQ